MSNIPAVPSLIRSPAWQALQLHFDELKTVRMRDLFAAEPERFDQFSLQQDDLLLDFSKHRITEKSFKLLMQLARQQGVEDWRDRMFRGEPINHTEGRSVLHVALRHRGDTPIMSDGEDVMPAVRAELDHMREFSTRIHNGEWRGYTGKRITDVVNLGIGGSDLGPMMVCEALKPYQTLGITPHFVSNVDGTHIGDTLKSLDPATTLFVIASKTFTTQETITNAHSARRWLIQQAEDESAIAKHFVAVSTNKAEVEAFGIDSANMFRFWNWVGGRFSLWSVIGLSIVLAVGMDRYEELLDGGYAMDQHFKTAPLEENMPVVMAMLGVWYRNFFNAATHAVLPYDQSMNFFADYFQQGDMESNGKSVDRDGKRVDYDTGPILWGRPGTNGQHAFYQLIHQGTAMVPCDFLAPVHSHYNLSDHHSKLLANFVAQSQALMNGRNAEESREILQSAGMDKEEIEARLPYIVFEGNKPSSSIMFDKLDPRTLGKLIALYEHKIFVKGVIWNINSFDQWGVELGKNMAKSVLADLESTEPATAHDASTNGLINYYQSRR